MLNRFFSTTILQRPFTLIKGPLKRPSSSLFCLTPQRTLSQGSISFKEWRERQQHQGERRKKNYQEEERDKKKKITYSKRRYIRLEGVEDRPNKHLYTLPSDAHGSSKRVTQLLSTAGINDALEFVTHLPLDLQSTVVWNQLIGYCAKHKRAQLANSIFAQMRERGIDPNERTFSHLLSTLRTSNSPTAVQRAEEWIEKMYQKYHIEPTVHHYNILFNCYIDKGKYNQVVAKVRQMIRDHLKKDERERITDVNEHQLLMPLPDHISLSTALNICPLVQNQPLKEVRRIYQHILYRLNLQVKETEHKTSALQEKALKLMAQDTVLLKDQQDLLSSPSSFLKKKAELEPLKVDDTLIVALLRCLSRLYSQQYYQDLRRSDHDFTKEMAIQFGQDIMDQIYGIQLDNQSSSSSSSRYGLTPTVKVLDSIVRYFGTLREFRLGENYYHFIVNNYSDVIPDKQAQDALAWMQTHKKSSRK